MRLNFKKISAIGASILLAGMSMGFAAAANFPSGFSPATTAVVYGANAASTDISMAQNISAALGPTGGSTTTTTVTGNESYPIKLASTVFTLGKGTLDVVSGTVTKSNMPTLLADGTYYDSSNNENPYTQKVTLANFTLGAFDDNNYAKDSPTLGVEIPNGGNILNYTLTFNTQPSWTKLASTNMNFMGKSYYVLSTSSNNDSMTLLDTANPKTLDEGSSWSTTVNGTSYNIEASFIGSNQVVFNVNNVATNLLGEGETQRLTGGAYIGVKSILYSAKTGVASQVIFSIGSGKLTLTNGTNVALNDNSISRLKAFINNGNSGETLSSITLQWQANGDQFIAPNSTLTMPGFGALSLVWNGFTTPSNENISVQPGGDDYFTLNNFPLHGGVTSNIDFVYGNGTVYTGTGSGSSNGLVTGDGNITFNGNQDDYFIASWSDGGANAESYLMRATSFNNPTIGSVQHNETEIDYLNSAGGWTPLATAAQEGDQLTGVGNIVLDVGAINYNDQTVVIAPGNSKVNFHTLYSADGMKVYLPYAWDLANYTLQANPGTGAFESNTSATGYTPVTSLNLVASEADKNGNIGAGNNVTMTLGWNSATTPQVSVTGVTGTGSYTGSSDIFREVGSSNVYDGWVYSPLATMVTWDKSGDQHDATLDYHGSESYGNVVLASSSSVSTSTTGGSTGVVPVLDTETSKYNTDNVIVVGGSCINSAAAKLLGVSPGTCGSAFTTATGTASVGMNKWLIKSYAAGSTNNVTTGSALLVAGYQAQDTVNAATYLVNQNPDVAAGNAYTGTTATSATPVVSSA